MISHLFSQRTSLSGRKDLSIFSLSVMLPETSESDLFGVVDYVEVFQQIQIKGYRYFEVFHQMFSYFKYRNKGIGYTTAISF